jgi:Rad3-related DNA helicase
MASGHRVDALSPKSERRILQAKQRWLHLISDLAKAGTRYLKDSKDLELLKMNASKRVRLLPSVGQTKKKEKTGFVWVAGNAGKAFPCAGNPGKASSPDAMGAIFENLKDQDEDAEKKCADEYAKRLKSLIKQRTNMSDIKNVRTRAERAPFHASTNESFIRTPTVSLYRHAHARVTCSGVTGIVSRTSLLHGPPHKTRSGGCIREIASITDAHSLGRLACQPS